MDKVTGKKLKHMVFKSFNWRYNPSTCTYSTERTVIKHQYPELSAVELEDFDPDGAVITGEGEFFGSDAYAMWKRLVAVFNQGGEGSFYHPVFSDVTHAVLKKLTADLDSHENYVKYNFEFWQTIHIHSSSSKKTNTTAGGGTSPSSNDKYKVGDTVIANGYVYTTSESTGKRGVKLVNFKTTITRTNYIKRPYTVIRKVHVGHYGWMLESEVSKASKSNTGKNGYILMSNGKHAKY